MFQQRGSRVIERRESTDIFGDLEGIPHWAAVAVLAI